MPIYLHTTVIAPEELTVTPNPLRGPVKFAVIALDDATSTGLSIHTTAEADALIRAAVEAKRLLLGDTVPPALAQDLAQAETDPANSYSSSKHGRYDAASAAEVAEGVSASFCASSSPTRHGHGLVRCTLTPGHDGDHVATGTGTPPASWPEGKGIDWDAVDKAQRGEAAAHLGPEAGHQLRSISVPADGAR